MSDPDFEHIIKEIKNEKWDYWKTTKIQDYLSSKQIELSNDELIELTKELVKRDVFGLMYAISELIKDLASTDEKFISLLTILIDKIKHDLAQGKFIDSLIQIGKSDADLAIKIAQKLLDDDATAVYSSYLLGGSAHTLFAKCYEIVEQLLQSENAHHKLAALRTLRVIYKDIEMTEKNKIFIIFETASKNEAKETKLESLEAFLDFYHIDKNRSEQNIEFLAKSSTDCKFSLAYRIWIKSPFNDDISMKFLELCSEDSNVNVKRHVCYALVHFVEKYPEQVLEILAKYVIRDGFGYESIGYVMEELGKVNAAKAVEIIVSWLSNDRDERLTFHIPTLVGELISKSDQTSILDPIFRLIETDQKHRNEGLEILLEIVSTLFDKNRDSELVKTSLSFLTTFAKSQRIDVDSLQKIENDPILLCSDIIYMLKYYSQDLNYIIIFKNLNEFPNIQDLFGVRWFKEKQKENNRTHPILKMLEQELPSKDRFNELSEKIKHTKNERELFNETFRRTNLMSTFLFLVKLEQDISMLKNKGFSMKNYATNLKNAQQFAATLSEIDFVTPFVSKFSVELEPSVNSKKLDAKIEIDSQSIYIEIISPNTFKPLDRLHGARGIPNRIKGKIYDEFKDQLKELTSYEHPIIVAIDIGRSEIDYEFVTDYLFGTLKFTFYLNKETHETAGSQIHRDESESMHHKDSETDLISAVICYKTRLYDDLLYRTEGKIFENPYAKVPLSRSVRKAIEENLFSRSLE